ncbi:MAG: phosphatase PAP2 family protein [Chitinophagales bacterium]
MILLQDSGHSAFFQHILDFDHWLFSLVNQQWTNRFFDEVLPFLRQAEIWIPFYVFLLVFILINFGRRGWPWVFSLAMTGIISDLVSSSLIKSIIFRYRPCNDFSLEDQVRVLVNYCPQSSSFTSSHACNHFAAAIFIFLTLKQTSQWWILVFVWASVISYSQVYVGVHFPLDVFGGAIIGSGIGYCIYLFFRSQFGSLTLKQSI